jgi:O-methyltransferase involved in polyketide biosynthesis
MVKFRWEEETRLIANFTPTWLLRWIGQYSAAHLCLDPVADEFVRLFTGLTRKFARFKKLLAKKEENLSTSLAGL